MVSASLWKARSSGAGFIVGSSGLQEELQRTKTTHADDQEALKHARDDAVALSGELQRQRDAQGQLEAEEGRLRQALADMQTALDDVKGKAGEQVAALEAALRLEEHARSDAERLLESERAAAERREAQEADRLSQEQVGVRWRVGSLTCRYEICQASPVLYPVGRHMLCGCIGNHLLVAVGPSARGLRRRSANVAAQLSSHMP